MKNSQIILLSLIGFIFLLSACTTNIEDALKQIPAIDAFLKEHPGAEIKISLWDATYVEANIDLIREKCGAQMTIREYYYVLIEEDNQKIEAFTEPDTGRAVCLIREGDDDVSPEEKEGKAVCNRYEGKEREKCYEAWGKNCDRLEGNEMKECYDKKQKEQEREWSKQRKVCERSGGWWNDCPSDCEEGRACAAVCGKPRCEEKAPCSGLDEDACDARKDCQGEYKIYEESCQVNENGQKICTSGKAFVCKNKEKDDENKRKACKYLNEKSCNIRDDCEPIYGPSSCSGNVCTTDIVYKGCKTKQEGSIRPIIATAEEAKSHFLIYFNEKWWNSGRDENACGYRNTQTGRWEPQEIEVEEEKIGFEVKIKIECRHPIELPPPEEKDYEFHPNVKEEEYLVKHSGEIYFGDEKVYEIPSTQPFITQPAE